ncbi:hypothetical protein [Butyrivibrio sp. FCS014]|uniref:hypothetical protein n=1 Tax=Butyrivibrio sp. FCS014 TaxID=1408304 RepID=UPI0004634B06|nr:hypothetical protein [Butyrivibrio sp. FCS014]
MIEDFYYARKQSLEEEIKALGKRISKFPEGSIIADKVKGKYRFYHQHKVDGEYKRSYLDKENRKTAEILATKRYLSDMLADKKNECRSLSAYLRVRKQRDYRSLLQKDSPYSVLLSEDKWEYEDYDRKTDYEEELIHDAPKGDKVRSKSEAIIAAALYEAGIPYRYECALEIESTSIYPDFTIKTGHKNPIYWEHFGKMDDPKYRNKAINKLRTYIKNGYIPGVNLIVTYETLQYPLSILEVKRMITHYFSN